MQVTIAGVHHAPADSITLKLHGLVSSLTLAPFIINTFIGSMVVTSMLDLALGL